MDLLIRITNKTQHQEQLNELYGKKNDEGDLICPHLVWVNKIVNAQQFDENDNPLFDADGNLLFADVDKSYADFKFASVPEDSKGNQAYQIVRAPNDHCVNMLTHCVVAAELVKGEYVWVSSGQKNAYEAHRGPFEWTETDPETGETRTVTKPYVMGGFL